MDGSDFALPHAPLRVAPHSSFLSPAASQSVSVGLSASPDSKPDYVTHLVSLQKGSPTGQLLALTSNSQCHLLDKHTLQCINSWAPPGNPGLTNVARLGGDEQGSCASFWGVTDRKGSCTIFDSRAGASTQGQSISIQTPTSSPLLSLAFSSSSSSSPAPLVALGHELKSIDAPVYVYDLRNTGTPLLTYDQSHSDDVTFLDFSAESLLLSGSTDGLMTIYDTSRGSDEDDAVLSATNTGSSLARGGWMARPSGDWASRFATAQESQQEGQLAGILGSIWAVSDMQTVGVWDAASTDPLMPPLSALPANALLPGESAWKSRQWETDYIVDAFPDATGGLNLIGGDQSGAMSLISIPRAPETFGGDPQKQETMAKSQPWSLQAFFPSLADSAKGGHDDIVRAIIVEDVGQGAGGQSLVWSGGEDGRVSVWDVSASADSATQEFSPLSSLSSNLDGKRAPDVPGRGGRRGFAGSASASPGVGNGSRFKPYG